MYKKAFLFSCLFVALCHEIQAQAPTFNGWFFSNHKQKLSDKWNFISDIQLRSADRVNYLQTMILRPGIQYKFADKQTFTAGYGYIGNWKETNGERSFNPEHRIWEQYNLQMKPGSVEINHRFRLEQRFVEGSQGFDFSQRLRYFLRTQIPLIKGKVFNRGMYAAIQNEIFLNIQHKENVNDHVFDQNRTYGALGYRFNKKVDLEAGYLYRYQLQQQKVYNNVLQVVLTTSF